MLLFYLFYDKIEEYGGFAVVHLYYNDGR